MALIKFSSVAARGLLAGCKQFLRAASTAAAETSSATPSAPATTTPSYTITELPVDKGAAVTRKVVASMKGIRGHSKKLNPVARQAGTLWHRCSVDTTIAISTLTCLPNFGAGILCLQIAGLSVSEAIAQLSFSPSSRGPAVKKAIERAAKQADLRHALPKVRGWPPVIGLLYVAESGRRRACMACLPALSHLTQCLRRIN